MKKIILVAMMLIGLTFSANAQEIRKNAIGFRIGDNDGFGGEVSYQRRIGDMNRLELDLGLRNSRNYDAIKLTGLYQWVWNIEGGFNWYVGAGGGIGSWRYDKDFEYFNNGNGNGNNGFYYDDDFDDSGTFLFIAGDIGIEYVFDIPLMLSLDFRPELYLADDRDNINTLGPDIALGVRFTF